MSAIPAAMSISYLLNQGDDLGRPVVQHKPLFKGEHEQACLSKVFDDPGMRPKIMGREPVNKTQTSLITSDIWGATSKRCDVFSRPRNTNPTEPRYSLPSPAPPPAASNNPQQLCLRDNIREILQPAAGGSFSGGEGPARDILRVTDIDGTRSKPYFRSEPRTNNCLDTTDIPGTWSGWKPNFRAHVGVNLRDPGLNVSDINNYMLPKNYKTLYKDQPQRQQQQQQEVAAAYAATTAPTHVPQLEPPQLPPGFVYTGLPVFQSPLTEAWSEPAETHQAEMETMAVARQQHDEVRHAVSDLEAAKTARRERKDAGIVHRALCTQAENRDEARRSADEALSQLVVGKVEVQALWTAFKEIDREGCGRLTVVELGHAFDRAGVRQSQQQLAALAGGLRDNVGLLPYRDLAKVLLAKSMNQLSDPKLFGSVASRRKPPVPSRPTSAAMPGNRASSAFSPPSRQASAVRASSASPQRPAPLTPPPQALLTPPQAPPPPVYQQQQQQLQQQPPQQPHDTNGGAQQGQQQKDASNPSPDGVKYHAFKAQAYWFGGAEGAKAQREEASAWKASEDSTHRLTSYHVGEQVAAAAVAAGGSTHHTRTIVPDGALGSPHWRPTSARLEATNDPAQASVLGHPSTAVQSQRQQPIFASAATGASFGATLKGTLSPVGVAFLHFGSTTHSRVGMHERPGSAVGPPLPSSGVSSRAASARAGCVSFSAVAQSLGGPKMESLNKHMKCSDIAAVRALY